MIVPMLFLHNIIKLILLLQSSFLVNGWYLHNNLLYFLFVINLQQILIEN